MNKEKHRKHTKWLKILANGSENQRKKLRNLLSFYRIFTNNSEKKYDIFFTSTPVFFFPGKFLVFNQRNTLFSTIFTFRPNPNSFFI